MAGWDFAQREAGIRLPFRDTLFIVLGMVFIGLIAALVTISIYQEYVALPFMRVACLSIAGLVIALALLAAVARLPGARAPLSDSRARLYLRFMPLYLAVGIIGGLLADALYLLTLPEAADQRYMLPHLLLLLGLTCAIPLVAGAIATAIALARVSQIKATQARLDVEDRYRILLENVSDIVITVDNEGKLTFVSSRVREVLGYEPEELVGGNFARCQFILPESMGLVRDTFDRAMQGEPVPQSYRARLRRRDGKIMACDFRVSTLRRNGQVVGRLALVIDITQQMETARKLEEAYQQFESLVDNLPDSVIITDLEGTVTRINPAFERTFGWTSQEVIGKPLPTVPADHLEHYLRLVEAVKRGETMLQVEGEALHKQGSRIPVAISVAPLHDAEGRLRGMCGIVSDIRERQRHEEELLKRSQELAALHAIASIAVRSSELPQLFEHALEKATEAVAAEAGALFLLNDEATELSLVASRGLSAGYMARLSRLGMGEVHSVKWLRAGQVAQMELSAVPSPHPHDAELREVAVKEGLTRALSMPVIAGEKVLGALWLARRSRAVFTPQEIELGGIIAAELGMAIQNTRLLGELRASEQRFRNMVELAQEGIWLMDKEGKTTFANPRMAEMLGYTRGEMVGRPLFDFMTTENARMVAAYLRRREQRMGEVYHFTLLRKDGNKVFALVATAPIFDSEGHYAGGLAVVTDITPLKQTEERLRLLNEISGHIVSALELPEVLDRILKAATQLTGAAGSYIWLLDEAKEELSFIAGATTVGQPPNHQARIKVAESHVERLVRRRQPVVVPDISMVEDHGWRIGFEEAGIRALADVPLIYEGKALGALGISYTLPHQFSIEEVGALQSLANLAAIALHHARVHQTLSLMAARDSLTGLYNRRELHTRLQAEMAQAQRYQRKCSLLFIDIDNFKAANEHFGHLRGDELLRAIARLLERAVRASDTVARYGGDEFAIVLPETDGDQAMVLARRLQEGFAQALSGFTWLAELSRPLSLSIGVSTFPEDAAQHERLIAAADQATFLAKLVGGDTALRYDRWPERLESDPVKLRALLKGVNPEALQAVATAIDARDSFNRGHCRRVSQHAVGIAREMGLDEAEVERLRIAALLHDLGKIGVAEAVLTKPGPLSPREQQEVQGHVGVGVGLLGGIDFLQDKLAIIGSHHENFDGSGYPNRLAGQEIPLGGRILRVADTFEAMTRERRYRKGWTEEEALAEIEQLSGRHFDPKVASALASSLRK